VSAPIFGPILGGWITDNLSWPWLFYINLPVGALSIAVTWSILHKRESQISVVPIDYLGLILLAIGIGSLQFMLDNGNDKDWFNSPMIIMLGVTAVVALTYLIAWELTDKHPILDLQLFKQRNFLVGVISVSVAYFSFFGVNVVFPLWLQTTLGYTATDAGLAMAPIGLATLFLAPLVGRYSNTMNLRAAVTFSFVVFALAMAWVSRLNGTATFWQLTLPRLWQGIGVAFFFLPLQQILMSGVKPNDLAAAAGLSSFIRTIAGSMSTAISTWLWDDRQQFHRALLSEHVRSDSAGWNQVQGTLNSLGFSDSQALGYASNQISQQAATLAVNDVYMMFAVVFLLLIPVVWFARPPFSSGKSAAH
jgi:DHA2 family multidrug resistance protein